MRKRSAKGFKVVFNRKTQAFDLIAPDKKVVFSSKDKNYTVYKSYRFACKTIPTDISMKDQRYTWEKKDCAVAAHANFAGISYAEAHQILKAMGRRDKDGTYSFISQEILKANGATEVYLDKKPILGQLPALYPTGKYFIFINSHVTVMINGVFYDQFQQGYYEKVKGMYTI